MEGRRRPLWSGPVAGSWGYNWKQVPNISRTCNNKTKAWTEIENVKLQKACLYYWGLFKSTLALKLLYKSWMKFTSHDSITMKNRFCWILPLAIRIFKLQNGKKFLFIIVTFPKLNTSVWIGIFWVRLSFSSRCQSDFFEPRELYFYSSILEPLLVKYIC